ncbi:hypothetical protein LOK49_LG02G00022 [Camellia lanceoleosa]|uniref:Uncharacterized protein n=1 Tax=Camellia lanceoleosa TaxID=1840588 RepID=A0ACC0INP3_9ERIC|nr:hypothetical protein LOK49_LG02G00022 [Camellia lanceoleosa]
MIGQTPYTGGVRRGGRPFRGRGSGPTFRGRGRGRGRGGPFPARANNPSAFVQEESSVRSAPLVANTTPKVATSTYGMPEKVEGAEDKQPPQDNLASGAVIENKVETEQKKNSEEAASTEGRGLGFKRKMRGGWGGKWMRTHEGSRRPVEPPKPKQVVPLVCELCNVKCDSQVVFESHLTGKKHVANTKRFQGHQAMLGQAALQALYPALQALYPPNPDASTSLGP